MSKIISVFENDEKKKPVYTTEKKVNYYDHSEKEYRNFSAK